MHAPTLHSPAVYGTFDVKIIGYLSAAAIIPKLVFCGLTAVRMPLELLELASH
jgi:hypothetical protein